MASAERLMALCTARGVALDAVSRGGLPELTPADVALAARGLKVKPWLAALYSLAGDDSVRTRVKTWLLESLLEAREAMQWATYAEDINGARVKFGERLVDMFLTEERCPSKFQAAPELRCIIMRVEPAEWRRVMSHQYQYVSGEYAFSLAEATSYVARRSR